MEEKKTFGKYIQTKRKEAGLSQKELAEKLFVSESAVSKWERGISYPDISLISSLCEILGVTERELLTSSEDVAQRNMERAAEKYKTLMKRYQMFWLIGYIGTLAICLIVNLAVGHRLSWFFIVLAAVLMGFSVTSLPGLLKKYKGPGTLGAFYGSLVLLLAVSSVYTHGHWFGVAFLGVTFGLFVPFGPLVLRSVPLPGYLCEKKALLWMAGCSGLLFALTAAGNTKAINPFLYGCEIIPFLIYELAFAWILFLIIRYTRWNKWLKGAFGLGLGGVWMLFENGMCDKYLGNGIFYFNTVEFSDWSGNINGNITMIIVLAMFGIAVIFFFPGMRKMIKRVKEKCDAA